MSLMLLRVSFHLRFTDFKLKVNITLLLENTPTKHHKQTITQIGLIPLSSMNRKDRISLNQQFQISSIIYVFCSMQVTMVQFPSLSEVVNPPPRLLFFWIGVKIPVKEYPSCAEPLYHNREMTRLQSRH